MDFVFAALVGWFATRWQPLPDDSNAVRPPPPDGPNPIPGPKPDPRFVLWGGFRDGLIGAITGVITVAVLGNHFTGSGIIGIALIAFAGGNVGAHIIGGAIDVVTAKSAMTSKT